MKTGRNAPCPCGSGKKYKHCCLNSEARSTSTWYKVGVALIVLIMLAGLFAAVAAFRNYEPSTGGGRVWSEEHQHWH